MVSEVVADVVGVSSEESLATSVDSPPSLLPSSVEPPVVDSAVVWLVLPVPPVLPVASGVLLDSETVVGLVSLVVD